jgi:DNA-binding LacI/PurR family transcriptional regulator
MNEVAAAAGVAQSTVSRILNNAPGSTSAKTRERVEAIAKELGYSPHPGARAMRGAPTMLLGAVVRDITDPFFGGGIEALTIAAKERGYSVVLGSAHARTDEALALAAVLEARQCDAIVLVGGLPDDLETRLLSASSGVTQSRMRRRRRRRAASAGVQHSVAVPARWLRSC